MRHEEERLRRERLAAAEREREAQHRRAEEERLAQEHQRWRVEQERLRLEEERRRRETEEAARRQQERDRELQQASRQELWGDRAGGGPEGPGYERTGDAPIGWRPGYDGAVPSYGSRSWEPSAATGDSEQHRMARLTREGEEEFRRRMDSAVLGERLEQQRLAEQAGLPLEFARDPELLAQRLDQQQQDRALVARVQEEAARYEGLPAIGSDGWAAMSSLLAGDPELHETAIALLHELRQRGDAAQQEADLTERLAEEERRRHHEEQALRLEARKADWEESVSRLQSEQDYWASLMPGTPDYARAFGESGNLSPEWGVAPPWQRGETPDQDRLLALEYQYGQSLLRQPDEPRLSGGGAGTPADQQHATRQEEADRNRAEQEEFERQAVEGLAPTSRELRLSQEAARRSRSHREESSTTSAGATEQQAKEESERQERARQLDQRLEEMAVRENYWNLTAEETQARNEQRAKEIEVARDRARLESEEAAKESALEQEEALKELRQEHLELAGRKATLASEEIRRLKGALDRAPETDKWRYHSKLQEWERELEHWQGEMEKWQAT